jgi:tetratricopeptide (TPR) repeat protein
MPNNDASPAVAKQGRYADAMDKGIRALNEKRTSDAVQYFQAALREVPNDRTASDGLQQAQNADNRNSQEFTRLANDGFKSLKLQRWAEAASSLHKALKVSPEHKDAPTVAQHARYADAMGRGKLALKSGNRLEAINAFQAALAEFPQDNNARLGLNQAMAMKKKF